MRLARMRAQYALAAALATALAAPLPAAAQSASPVADSAVSAAPVPGPVYIPDISRVLPPASGREALSASLQVLVLLTVLTLAPSIVLMMTCFTRMVVVLVLLRQALGTATLPPTQVLIGLALFLTFLVMGPTWERVRQDALDPYMNGEIEQLQAVDRAADALRGFMFEQIRAAANEQDVYMLYEYATGHTLGETETIDESQVPMSALAPAFVLSELKVAFILGFRIYLPFLVIDMVIATVLVSMGMMMLPPVLISLPFKLLLFVLADGWHLVAGALLASVR